MRTSPPKQHLDQLYTQLKREERDADKASDIANEI